MQRLFIGGLVALAFAASDAHAQYSIFPKAAQNVGNSVGAPVGTPVGASAMQSSIQQVGSPIDPNLSVAPVPGSSSGMPFFDKFYKNLMSIVPFRSQSQQVSANTNTNNGWFPSLGRRNRERHKQEAVPVWWLD